MRWIALVLARSGMVIGHAFRSGRRSCRAASSNATVFSMNPASSDHIGPRTVARHELPRLAVMIGALFMTALAAAAAAAMTNKDVIEMVKAGLPESTIVLAVERDTSGFSTSAQDLIQLKKQGVSQPVLDAMLGGGATASPATPSMGGGMQTAPTVVAIDGSRRVTLMQAAPNMKTSGMGGVIPFVDAKTKVSFAGARAEIRLTSPTSMFELPLRTDAHVSEQVYLIHMHPTRASRDSVDSSVSMMGSVKTGPTSKDLVPSTITPLPGKPSQFGVLHRITPTEPLAPGEYAINVQGRYYDFGVD